MSGPLLICLASLLWATDAIFRTHAIHSLDPIIVVFIEHSIGALVLLPWLFFKNRRALFTLTFAQWLSAAFVGIGGSAIATILFTASFKYINPSVAILLQKLQPILVVLLAFLFLKERPKKTFYGWALVALSSAIILSFPTFDFRFLSGGIDPHSKGVLLAISAAILWAGATIFGKVFLRKNSPGVLTFWRYAFGWCAAAALLIATPGSFSPLISQSLDLTLLYMSLVPGVLAMLIYYSGLSRTPASVATFAELTFPLGAIILNTIFLHAPLSPVEVLSGVILVFSVLKLL